MNDRTIFSVRSFIPIISVLLVHCSVYATVSPVIPGESLWCVVKRIADTTNSVESKISTLASDLSLLDALIAQEVLIALSETDLVLQGLSRVDSLIDIVGSQMSIIVSHADIISSLIDPIDSQLDNITACSSMFILNPTTITASGTYCLAQSIVGPIAINASNVVLNLNNHGVTGTVSVGAGHNLITIENGVVENTSNADAIVVQSGTSNITLSRVTVKNALRGIHFSGVAGAVITHCEMIGNTTGLELNNSFGITIDTSSAIANKQAGFSFVSSYTNCVRECTALSTGKNNTNVTNNFVYGFVSRNGTGNIFENCIANATQALSTTDYNSTIAGFAFTGTEHYSKIISCEASNAISNAQGVTVPYGIYLESTVAGFTTVTQTQPVVALGSQDSFRSYNWSSDGVYLVSGIFFFASSASKNSLYIYHYDRHIDGLVQIASFGAGISVYDASWSPDGNYIAVGSDQSLISNFRVYSFDNENNQVSLLTQDTTIINPRNVQAVAWSPDMNYIAVGEQIFVAPVSTYLRLYSFDRVAETMTLQSNELLAEDPVFPQSYNPFIASLAWSPDGNYLAVSGLLGDFQIRIYELQRASHSLKLVATVDFGELDATVDPVRWSPDGKYLLANRAGNIFIYSFAVTPAPSLTQVLNVSTGGLFSDVQWSADGRYIVGGGLTRLRMYLFNRSAPVTLNQVAAITYSFSVISSAVAWSPDGQLLAAPGSIPLTIYNALTFPYENVIQDNTAYCNSGGSTPSGIGIAGPSICNYIVGNTSYSNPSNPFMVPNNYAFACNVFNPLFNNMPTYVQNIGLGTCEPIPFPDNEALLAQQALTGVQLVSALASLESLLDTITIPSVVSTPCNPTAITTPTTISTSGVYCLGNNITGSISISASNVVLDLSSFFVSGSISVASGLDSVTIRNGTIKGSSTVDAIRIESGCSNITLSYLTTRNAQRGIFMDTVHGGRIDHCEMIQNITGLELNMSSNIVVNESIARSNQLSGFALVSSFTNLLTECQALTTGQGNTNVINNNVYGFVSQNGFANIFENCIANATQALSTTDYGSIVAGFALTGTENGTKIIGCEAANAATNASGVTVPYGMYLQPQFDGLISVTSVNNPNYIIASCQWSFDGKYLAAGGGFFESGASDLHLYRFDRIQGLVEICAVNVGDSTNNYVNALGWSPDGQYLAVAVFYYGNPVDELIIYRFNQLNESLTQIFSLDVSSGSDRSIWTLAWSPDAQYLAIGGTIDNDDLIIYRFNSVAQTLSQVASVNPGGGSQSDAIYAVSWSPDGQYLAIGGIINTTSSDDLIIYRFDRATQVLSQVASVNPGGDAGDTVYTVAWSPDGQYLAIGGVINTTSSDDLIIYRFDRATQVLSQVASVNPGGGSQSDAIYAVSWSPDGQYLAIGGEINTTSSDDLIIYRFDRGTQVLSQIASVNPGGGSQDDAIYAVSWSPDGHYVAIGGDINIITSDGLIIYSVLSFPSDNVIKDNVVYCNSGAQFPSGVGVCGSSICNMIIQNTAYSNPLNPPIVSSNYQFVCNVFNQLFGDAPTVLQNIALGSCELITVPANSGLLASQLQTRAATLQNFLNPIVSNLAAISSMLDILNTTTCSATPITSATTINNSGVYCLANDVTSSGIMITADNVVLDLNNHSINSVALGVDISNVNNVTVKNGTVIGSLAGIRAQNAFNITLSDVVAKNSVLGDGIVFNQVTNACIERCRVMNNDQNGIVLNSTINTEIKDTIASGNQKIGFSLVLSSTNYIHDCQALSTGFGNTNILNNNVYGFVSENGFGNIFENCIANATQALSTTDFNSIVAGFALTGTESYSKIIDCEASNAQTSAQGVTIPYGIYLQGTFSGLVSLTSQSTGGLNDSVSALSWSNDDAYIAVGGTLTSNDLQIYQCNTMSLSNPTTRVATFDLGSTATAFAVQWSPDNRYIVVGGDLNGNDLRIIKFERANQTLSQVASINTGSPLDVVYAAVWSPNGNYVAVGGALTTDDLRIYYFDRVAQTLTQAVSQSTGSVSDVMRAVAWTPDGNYIAIGGTATNEVQVYAFTQSPAILTQVASINIGTDTVRALAWSPDGHYLAVGGVITGDDLQIYRRTGTMTLTLVTSTIGTLGVFGIAWSPDGRYLAVGGLFTGADLNIYAFDRGSETLQLLQSVSPGGTSSDAVQTVAWSPDGRFLLVGGTVQGTSAFDMSMYRALSFPSYNMIRNNTTYCNAGAQYQEGVGISGSSICNMIIQNTAYANPTNPPMIASNYYFVCNVFNQLFGDAPSLTQNIALGACEPIQTPEQLSLILKQALYQESVDEILANTVQSSIAQLSASVSEAVAALSCGDSPITSNTTITTSGIYCLANSAVTAITISANNVVLDLNDRTMNGSITITSRNNVTIRNGSVNANGGSFGISAQSGSSNITISQVLIRNGVRGVALTGVQGGLVSGCEFTQNTTGIELQQSADITIKDSIARSNVVSGFSLVSSATNTIYQCSALATGQGNAHVINNNVYGFVSQNGFANVFENCIANATQALSTTDYGSIVAGFALMSTESCSKIIACEAANATTNQSGVTVPYGIYLGNQPNVQQITTGLSIRYAFWSPDGNYIALATTVHQIQLYRFNRASQTLTFITQMQDGDGLYSAIAWSPDGQYIATGIVVPGNLTQLSLYRFERTTETVTPVFSVVYPSSNGNVGITSLSFSPDGQYLGLCGKGLGPENFQVYRFDTILEQLRLVASTDTFADLGDGLVTWSPDGQYIAFGIQLFSPVRIYTFNRVTNALILRLAISISWPATTAFSPDGNFVAVGDGSGVRIFRINLVTSDFTLVATTSLVGTTGLSWSPDGRYMIVSAGGINYFYLFNRGTLSLNVVLQTAGSAIKSWSPDGQYIVTGAGISRVLNVPTNTVIKNNTVYCNSGAQYPSGIGISGASIGNYIVGNVAYSNPINPFSVSTNYAFACNVYNQLFQTVPTLLQNIALGSCEQITMPDDTALLLQQALNQQSVINARLDSALDLISSVSLCNASAISSATTIASSGYYCLSTNITGSIVINASDVTLDLSNRVINGSIIVSGRDSVTILNGRITATSSTNGIDVQIGSSNINIQNVIITNAQRGISLSDVANGTIASCELVNNTTGVELTRSYNIHIDKTIARSNLYSGFSLVSSFTNLLTECQALATGQGNTNVINNNVYGFVSQNGFSNIFENCIANATQALSTTDYNSIVAGFALTGTENGTKIIGCEAGNAVTSARGVTVPYGIYLQDTLSSVLTLTATPVIPLPLGNPLELSWSPDGQYLAVPSNTVPGLLAIYYLDRIRFTLEKIAEINIRPSAVVGTAQWSPDGRFIAIGEFNANATDERFWVVSFNKFTNTLRVVAVPDIAPSGMLRLAWSPDMQYIAFVGNMIPRFMIYRFDAVNFTLTRVVANTDLTALGRSVSWSPDSEYLAVGSDVGANSLSIYKFDRATQSVTRVLLTAPVAGVATQFVTWSQDGQYLAILNGSGTPRLRIYSFNRLTNTLTLRTQTTTIGFSTSALAGGLAWFSNDRYLLIGMANSPRISVVSFDRGTNQIAIVASPAIQPASLSFSTITPDGQFSTVSLSGSNLFTYRTLTFPYNNIIQDNMVYCNSGAQFPSGIGISGSSICNYIVGNTAYSNPINPSITSTNYAFVCNVFNQLFGDAPTALQNIALGSCDPLLTPGNTALVLKQAISAIQGLGSCSSTSLTTLNTPSSTTLSASGGYCLASDITSDISIAGPCITLDLNDHCLTGVITVTASDDIVIKNGIIKPAAPTTVSSAITIASTVNRAIVKDVTIACANTTASGIAGRSGISVAGNNTSLIGCTITSGAGAPGTPSGGAGGDGIVLQNDATHTLITNCTIITGTGGNSVGGVGARGGHGIYVQQGASRSEIFGCLISRTGAGGSGDLFAGGDGGDGVNIESGAVDTAVRSCIIRNTGVGGSGSPAGRGGQAVHDVVTSSATASLIFKNFAFGIADATKFDIQALGETGIITPNPPTATIINPFANVFVS